MIGGIKEAMIADIENRKRRLPEEWREGIRQIFKKGEKIKVKRKLQRRHVIKYSIQNICRSHQ